MSIGIYKIISPSNKIYIGQSVNIEKRWNIYKLMYCKGQVKLYNSLKKHGVENHMFEIIEECSIEQLNERETHWKQQFIEKYGWDKSLFCQIKDGKGGYKSEETKQKISDANKGKPKPEGFGLNQSQKMKGRISPIKGIKIKYKRKWSDETKQKMSISHQGLILGPQSLKHKNNISKANKGRKLTPEQLEKHKNKKRPKPEGFGLNQSQKMKGRKVRLDKKQYVFLQTLTLEQFIGTQSEFYTTYNLNNKNVSGLIKNRQKSHKNWILLKNIA